MFEPFPCLCPPPLLLLFSLKENQHLLTNRQSCKTNNQFSRCYGFNVDTTNPLYRNCAAVNKLILKWLGNTTNICIVCCINSFNARITIMIIASFACQPTSLPACLPACLSACFSSSCDTNLYTTKSSVLFVCFLSQHFAVVIANVPCCYYRLFYEAALEY